MKKILFCSALAAVALSSCSSDDFMGDTPGNAQSNTANSAIKFDGNAGKISRATSNSANTTQGKLDYQFKIYGVKSGADNKYSKVFENYNIWWNTTKTASNTNDWEYVANKGTISTGETATKTNIELSKDQTIKYWDYASNDYHFVAGSPIENFDYKLDQNGNIASAEIKGLGGHIEATPTGKANTFNPVYVAKPKVVAKTDYQKPVQFEFVRQQSMVRVGIYETIPGYEITDIKFYKQGETGLEKVDATNNIILTSATPNYFVGGKDVTGTITYDWTTPTYSFNYTGDYTKSKNWYAGAITGVKATTSAATNISDLYGSDGDMDANNGYFIVMPTLAEQASAILIKCDYTLKSTDGSGEVINVKGATAAIPAAYSKWDINTRYTYLFKISENTNGTTGNPDKNDPAGLYPITFNAVVTEMTDKTEGTTTTFTAPSITTYQKGSVEGNTIKYVANKNIDVTVLNDKAVVQNLTNTNETAEQVGHIAVYKFDTEITEAEVQVKGVTGATAITGNVNNNVFTFKPTAAGWYAIKYLAKAKVGTTPAVYTYKVVYVEAATK